MYDDWSNKEMCQIGFGGYDECPELWFCIASFDANEEDRIDSMIRMGDFPVLHKLEHPEQYISITRADYEDDCDQSVFHISSFY